MSSRGCTESRDVTRSGSDLFVYTFWLRRGPAPLLFPRTVFTAFPPERSRLPPGPLGGRPDVSGRGCLLAPSGLGPARSASSIPSWGLPIPGLELCSAGVSSHARARVAAICYATNRCLEHRAGHHANPFNVCLSQSELPDHHFGPSQLVCGGEAGLPGR